MPASTACGSWRTPQKEAGVQRRLVQFALADTDAFAYHDEPVYRAGVLAGRVSSAELTLVA